MKVTSTKTLATVIAFSVLLAACAADDETATLGASSDDNGVVAQTAASESSDASDAASPDTVVDDTVADDKAADGTEVGPVPESTPEPVIEPAAEDAATKFEAKGFKIESVNLSNAQTTTLLDVVDGDKPVVLWGWAPHCGACMAKVPEWNSFAENNPDVQVIGIGQTDTLDLAKQFQARTSPNFDMVYATGGNIWGEAGLGFQDMTVYTADLTQNSDSAHFSDSSFLEKALAAAAA